MAQGVHKITQTFEQELAKYTGAKYVVTLDNMSNALFLALYYEHHVKERCEKTISIPSRTYPSVPCEIGTNSSIKEKINICDDVTIGLNAGVVKDITEPGIYVGVPAKKIK